MQYVDSVVKLRVFLTTFLQEQQGCRSLSDPNHLYLTVKGILEGHTWKATGIGVLLRFSGTVATVCLSTGCMP